MNETDRIVARDAWIEGSAFRKPDGTPLVWYHGTDCDTPFNVFTRWEDFSVGFHFGNAPTANARIYEIGRMGRPEDNDCTIIPVICRARNPLRIRDQYAWGIRKVLNELIDLEIVPDEEDMFDMIADGGDAHLVAAIEAAGYDCIVYANECEDKEGRSDSLMVWRPELLKSPFATSFDRDDPRLLPQNPTDARDMTAWSTWSDEIAQAAETLGEEVHRSPVLVS